MTRILAAVFVIVGLAIATWGTLLIRESFVNEMDTMYRLKAPTPVVAPSVHVEHERQANKQALVQVGLVVIGTAVATAGAIDVIRRRSRTAQRREA